MKLSQSPSSFWETGRYNRIGVS